MVVFCDGLSMDSVYYIDLITIEVVTVVDLDTRTLKVHMRHKKVHVAPISLHERSIIIV